MCACVRACVRTCVQASECGHNYKWVVSICKIVIKTATPSTVLKLVEIESNGRGYLDVW